MTKMMRKIRPDLINNKQLLIFCLVVMLGANALAQPSWTVDPGSYSNNMTITGAINLNHEESRDADDIIAAFIDGKCRGIAQPVLQGTVDRYIVYLMVYSNDVSGTIQFKVYDASTVTEVDIDVTMEYTVNGIVGYTEGPYIWSSPTISNKAEILTFSVPGQVDTTVIDEKSISLMMPYGSDITGLVAAFISSPDAAIKVNDVIQTSGISVNDFSSPVNYQVQSADETTEKTFTVSVIYANAIPSDIYLTSNEVAESEGYGTVIGLLSTEDANPDDSHLYSLVSGTGDTDNDSFLISGNELSVNTEIDYETKAGYSIRVQTDDYNGGQFEKQIAITVIDEQEIILNAVNVFSPNNDGINDYWMLENNQTFKSCNFYIFNNIGEIIYESTGYNNDWDGTYKGRQLPVSTYFYIIKCPNCSSCNYSGSISIIR
ncbi:MAG TPA: T9SS type B sorting domain-containing protein [Bacteroides sp.]|nr:T9SS type B sorting domain-containing protein [Bacteroides sp.]